MCGAEEHLGIWSLAGVVKGRGASSGRTEATGPGRSMVKFPGIAEVEDIGVGLRGLN